MSIHSATPGHWERAFAIADPSVGFASPKSADITILDLYATEPPL